MAAPPSKFYTVSTLLLHKYGGANVAVTNLMSYFSMFVPKKATVKLANGNTGHSQGIGIILYHFPNCSVIYPVGPAYYFPGHPSNTISSGVLKFILYFKRLCLNLFHIVTLLIIKAFLGDQLTTIKTISITFKSKLAKSTLKETGMLLPQLSVHYQNEISLSLFISVLVMSLLSD